MSTTWVTILIALLLFSVNCSKSVVIQSDLDGEEVRGTDELVSLSTIHPSAFPVPGA